jgi:hypothetical protein
MRTRLMPYASLFVAAALAVAACGPKQASGGTAVKVTNVDLGRSLKPDLKIDDNATTFKPTDVIYASVETKGTGPATLATRWTYQDNQTVNESSRTISPNGDDPVRTEFHISKPEGFPEGKYHLVVLINGTTAGTKDFEVKK